MAQEIAHAWNETPEASNTSTKNTDHGIRTVQDAAIEAGLNLGALWA